MLNGTIYSLSNEPLYDVKQNMIYEYGTSNFVGSISRNFLSIYKEKFTISGENVIDSEGNNAFRIFLREVNSEVNNKGLVVLVLLAALALVIALLFLPLYFSITDFTKIDFVNKLVCKIKKKEYVKPGEKVWTDFGKKIRVVLLVASILPFVTMILTAIIPAMATFGGQLALGIAVACLVARFFLFKKKKDLLLVVTESENDQTVNISEEENKE